MSSKWKRKGGKKFVMIDGYVKRSPSWAALTPIERAAYIELKWKYDGTNNGRIALGCRELAALINMGRDTADRALSGLVEKGFIAKAKASGFNVKHRASTEWRLTEYACDVTGELPTKDFMRWPVQKKQQSDPSDTQSDPSDTKHAETLKIPLHSPIRRTVRPENSNPQSDPSDTYRYTKGGRADAA